MASAEVGPVAFVTGTVTAAPSGAPLAGICVVAQGAQGVEVTARTDTAGRYQLPVAPGDHTISFNDCDRPVVGWALEPWRGAASDVAPDAGPAVPQAAVVRLVAGEVRPGIDAALDVAARLRGSVRDDVRLTPLPQVCVDVVDVRGVVDVQARTGSDGTYLIANLPAGDYNVWFEDCGSPYTHRSTVRRDPDGQGARPPVSLQAAAATTVDAALVEGGAVTGRVRAAHTGRGLPFMCVEALDVAMAVTSAEPAFTFTGYRPGNRVAGDDATFVLAGLRPGRYEVGVNGARCDAGYSSVRLVDVAVDLGSETGPLDIVLEPVASTDALCAAAAASPSFADVAEDTVHGDAIECLASLEVARGRTDRVFAPGEVVSRAQLASFVARGFAHLGVDLPVAPLDAFADDDASPHEAAINQLASLGILGGTGGGRFSPGLAVNRGQMASVLVRAYEHATGFALQPGPDRFGDDAGSSHEAGIARAATAAFTTGRTATTFEPDATVRREQLASFLARTLDRAVRDR